MESNRRTKSKHTGNLYGIYDLSGGGWERTAGYVSNGNGNIDNGKSFATKTGGTSNQYVKVYAHDVTEDVAGKTEDGASEANYKLNSNVYGNAMNEISSAGKGTTSWHGDCSEFVSLGSPFSVRGGIWYDKLKAGMFYFAKNGGSSGYLDGFRPVLVAL